jgi:hypothetical protein
MERLVDRQQVRQEVFRVRVLQVVDPLDPHGPVDLGLDGPGRIAEGRRVVCRAVTPDRGLRERAGEKLLLELTDRDLIVIDAAPDSPLLRHHLGDRERVYIFWDRRRIEAPSRYLGRRPGNDQEGCRKEKGYDCQKNFAQLDIFHKTVPFLMRFTAF